MSTLHEVLKFISDNLPYLLNLVTLLAAIKVAFWGASKAAALNSVVDAVQKVGAQEVKAEVARDMSTAPTAVAQALETSVLKSDPSKPDPVAWKVILREALRGVFHVKNIT